MTESHFRVIGARPARPTGAYFGVVSRLNDPQDTLSLSMNWVYFIIKILILLATLSSLALCVVVSAGIFTYDGPDFRVFLSNTFYTTQDAEPNVTWQVLTQPANDIQVRNSAYSDVKFEHFYECMWISRLQYDVCSNDTLVNYITCIRARPLNASQNIDSCAVSYNLGQAWPSASSYTNCINNKMGGSRKTLNALRTCVRIKPWPIYEVPQEVDSPFFLGSFSWPMLMLTGFLIYILFGIYTIYPVDWEDVTVIEYGKPGKGFGLSRMGLVWILLALLGSAGWAFACILISFRAGSTWPNGNANPFPSTQSTNIITVSASVFAFFYFLLEISEYFDRRVYAAPEAEASGDKEKAPFNKMPATMFMTPGGYAQAVGNGLGYYFPDPTRDFKIDTIRADATQYAPVLLKTWADAYLFDVIFFVGALGATMQLGTAEITNLFWALVYYRIAHMGVARMVYESYVRGAYEDIGVNELKDKGLPEFPSTEKENASLCMKINALALHFAAVCALILFYSLVSNKYHMLTEYSALQDLCFFGIYIPELLRILGHMYLLLRSTEVDGSKGVYILVFSHFVWMWDMAVRGIFLYLYFYGADTYIGTKPFLLDKFYTLNSTMIAMDVNW